MAQLIAQSVIDEILARTDIVQLVGEYVELKKKGSQNYFGLCPFHQEKTPSFSVAMDKQIFHCFGCQKGGNAITFIQEMEHLDFREACAFLAERLGIELVLEATDDGRKELIEGQKLLHLEAARYFYKLLQTRDQEAKKNYLLNRRGLSEATLRKFGLGCTSNKWDGLVRHLRSKGFNEEQMLQSGLVRKSSKGTYYDLFRDRVMFPILDHKGTVVAFGGRVLDDREPKYLNSPETPIYHKGREVYAYNFAKRTREDYLILTEGYLDTLALFDAGFDNACAGLGTALTQEQVKLIQRCRKSVILCYDSDNAGIKAALAALDLFEKNGVEVKIAKLPEGMDPDDTLQHLGPERFRALLEDALEGLDFKLALARDRSRTEEGQDILQFQDSITEILAQEQNPVTRELYAGKYANELNVSKSAMLEAIRLKMDDRKKPRRPDRSYRAEEDPWEKVREHISADELLVILALIQDEVSERDLARLKDGTLFRNPNIQSFVTRLIEYKQEMSQAGYNVPEEDGQTVFADALPQESLTLSQLLQRAAQVKVADKTLAELLQPYLMSDDRRMKDLATLNQRSHAALARLEHRRFDNRLETLRQALAATTDKDEQTELLLKIQDLQKQGLQQ